MKRVLILLLALAVLCPAAAWAETGEKRPAILGDFETTDVFGNACDSSVTGGAALTFVNVWGTYCDPCINELPDLAALADEFQGRVQFLGVVGDTNFGHGVDQDLVELAQLIVEQTGADNYPHLIPSDAMNERVLFSVTAFPTSFFLDSEGRQVGYAVIGSQPKEKWREIIGDALATVESAEEEAEPAEESSGA